MVADGLLAGLLTAIALPMLFLPSENFERLYAAGFRDPDRWPCCSPSARRCRWSGDGGHPLPSWP
jgi:hypothetical protein